MSTALDSLIHLLKPVLQVSLASVASGHPELVLCLPVILTSSTVVIRRMRGRLKWSLFFFLFVPCRFSVSTPLIHSFGAEWRRNHVEAATAAIASVGGFHGSQALWLPSRQLTESRPLPPKSTAAPQRHLVGNELH